MTSEHTPTLPKDENPLWNLLLNIVIPSVILLKFSEPNQLGPVRALVLAISIPIGYGIFDWFRCREFNLFSILGAASVALTGGLGLIQAEAIWIAVKEASFPLFFAVAILASTRTSKPLVRTFLMSPQIVDVPAIEHALEKTNSNSAFRSLLFRTSLVLAASMILCSALSFSVAIHVLQSAPGTPEFNHELGHMNYLSFLVAGIPSLIVLLVGLWMLVRGIRNLTGLDTDDIFNPR